MFNISEIYFKNPSLRPAEIDGMLYILLHNNKINNNTLIRITGLPKETIKNFKISLSGVLEPTEMDEISIKKEYLPALEKCSLRPYQWSLLESSEDNELSNKIEKIRKEYGILYTDNKRELDQFFATPQATSAKVKALSAKGLIKDSKIALLGDDDLVSIALMENYKNEPFKQLDVYDVDQGLLTIIKTHAQKLGLNNVQTFFYDFKNSPNPRALSTYNVVQTDPPYTRNGVALFLSRAVQLSNQYIYLLFGNSFKSPEKTHKIQDLISSMGLVIEDKIDKFARYYGAESIGSASSLYILKKTPFSQPLSEPELKSEIYTYQKNEGEEKFPYVDHFVLKLNDVDSRLLTSKKALQAAAGEFCRKHRLKVVDSKITQFSGKGMTLTFVLANSNLVIHTWPEYSALHIDLITCSPIYFRDSLARSAKELFKADSVSVRRVE